jgi:hypothetical protein
MSTTDLNDALWRALTEPAPHDRPGDQVNAYIVAIDALSDFTRAKMKEDGFTHFAWPYVPEGAPWWEIGWRAEYVVRSWRLLRDQLGALDRRTMTRAEWQDWYSEHRARSSRRPSRLRFEAQLEASMAQLGRVAALIREAGHG